MSRATVIVTEQVVEEELFPKELHGHIDPMVWFQLVDALQVCLKNTICQGICHISDVCMWIDSR
jgi:hypothetical protein